MSHFHQRTDQQGGLQNLTTQWHVRYDGRGVMIYWHVERNSLCIHSQLKSPSSSEVASMIEGVGYPLKPGHLLQAERKVPARTPALP